jgi:hypothetical protein
VRRAEIKAHRDSCLYRERACALLGMGCQFKGTAEQMTVHMKDASHWQFVATEMMQMQSRLDQLAVQYLHAQAAEANSTASQNVSNAKLPVLGALIGLLAVLLMVSHKTGCEFTVCAIAATAIFLQHTCGKRPHAPNPMNLRGRKLCKIFSIIMLVALSVVWLSMRRNLLWVGLICVASMFVVEVLHKNMKAMESMVPHPQQCGQRFGPSCALPSFPATTVAPSMRSFPGNRNIEYSPSSLQHAPRNLGRGH